MKIIGLMSGTSADGVDIALCDISGEPPQLRATIIETKYVPYPAAMREIILHNCDPIQSNARSICQANFDVARFFAEAIGDLAHHADIIASHGQTIWHEVDDQARVTSTLQIGSGAVLAELTGKTVINNFRERDVAAGGQGAPLTSYVDWLLLRHPTQWRAIQNIGGMGNVTFLPPLNDTQSKLIAFDTGVGNALIDVAVHHLTGGKQTYDVDGEMAAQGNVHGSTLETLLSHPYYEQSPPKTTGRERFGTDYALKFLAETHLSPQDTIATLTALTATSIAQAYRDFAPQPIGEVIIGGGGAKNPTLMQMLQSQLGEIPVMTHEHIGLDSEFKEALVFAVLAYETWHHRPATLPEQTGATHASILGQITMGANYPQLIRQTWCP